VKVPLSWLRDFVDVELPPRELAARLTLAGVEVESLHSIGDDWDKVYVGYVESVERHPNADRLSLVRVVAGEHQLTVVTGAPNIAQGQKVPMALVGAELWDGHSEEKKRLKLKSSSIRGVPSEGMVCSEKELGLSDEHEGIMVLPEDAPVGMPLQDYLGDSVFELEITPNLVHDFSVIGVAREVAALTKQRPHAPQVPPLPQVDGDAAGLDGGPLIVVEDSDLCPRYVAVVVEGVKVAESPEWLKRRLTAAGQRPINNIADITNYVMLEYGQPQHAFDRDKLAGGRIIVRRAEVGERMETLDHTMRTLDDRMLTISDGNRKAVGLAGVIGGLESEIGDDTTNVLLESANFDMYSTRHTFQTLKLPTDAAVRFGRGLDPALAWPAAERAVQLMLELCPGARVTAVADVYPNPVQDRAVVLPHAEIQRLLGVTYPSAEVIDVLGRLELHATYDESGAEPVFHVTVPTWRQDITQKADLVEEIIRIIGYDTLPTTLPEGKTVVPQRDPLRRFADEVRDILAASGLHEIICYSLTDEPTIDKLSTLGTWVTWWEGHRPSFESTRLVNTLRSDWAMLRPTLMASALQTLAENLKYQPAVRLFEARPIYFPRNVGELPKETLMISIAMAGERQGRGLHTASGAAGASLDFFDLKGAIEALLARLGLGRVSFTRSDYAAFHPGRAAELHIGGDLIGVFGEVHPKVAANFGIGAERTMLAELDLEALAAKAAARPPFQGVPRFQATVQDFAVVVDEAMSVGTVQETILSAAKPLAASARLFDVYRGEQIPAGKKSLAFEVVFSASDRALPDEEIARTRGKIANALERRLGAALRA
jgi:phenylalanyl-tRNA synthetase beta chain